MNKPLNVKECRTGTHRAASIESTRERVWPLLPAFGITRVANITGLDHIGIPVVAVFRPNARSLSVAQGKGLSLEAAEVSGVMEAIEGFHAENVSSPVILASYNQLRFSHSLIEPDRLPRSAVGRFDVDRKIHWISAVDLGGGKERWVPYELVHTDFTLPLPTDSGCFALTSNGLASGNHEYEAISHGIAELIERDASTLFSLLSAEQRDQRAIDPSTIESDDCRGLLRKFADADVEVGIWDLTTDIGVAVFRAVIMDRELVPGRISRPNVGTGCHPSREVALCRALTEAAQSRLTVISSSRDDLPRERYDTPDAIERVVSLRTSAMPTCARRAYAAVPSFDSNTIEGDVLWQRRRLSACGLDQLLVVDLGKPEFEIAVVRVIVPGLEGSREHAGWTPGSRAAAVLRGAA